MFLSIFVVWIIREKTGFVDNFGLESEEVYHAVLMLVLTFTGLVMLYRICQPFNVVRAVTYIIAVACCVIIVASKSLGTIVFENWDSIELILSQWLLLIILIQASFPISGFFIKAFDMMNTAEES